jgi:transposase
VCAVKITKKDYDSIELRKLAQKSSERQYASRLYALADLLEGKLRKEVGLAHSVTTASLRLWILRYNQEGLEGLKDKPRSGRKPCLNEAQKEEFCKIVETGPTAEDGVIRWRCIDLQKWLKEKHNVDVNKRTVGKLLDRYGFSHMSGRPVHHKNDPEAIETFKKNLRYYSASRT